MGKAMSKEDKAKKWLSREGFNEQGYTYVYYDANSYQIRDQLKDAGFRFNKILLWHSPNENNFFAQKTFPIHWSAVLAMMAWGEGNYYPTAADVIKGKIAEFNPKPVSNSKFIEPVNGKIDVEAECIAHRIIETNFGLSHMLTFKAGEDVITWFTSSTPNIEVGDTGELVGCFKKHETYNGVDTTYITRAKLK